MSPADNEPIQSEPTTVQNEADSIQNADGELREIICCGNLVEQGGDRFWCMPLDLCNEDKSRLNDFLAWHQRKLEAEVAKAHRRGRLSMYADIVNGLSEEDVKLLARLVQLKKDNPSE